MLALLTSGFATCFLAFNTDDKNNYLRDTVIRNKHNMDIKAFSIPAKTVDLE